MGAGPSLDAEKDAAQKILTDFLASFAKNYSKCYVIGLMKENKKKMLKEGKPAKWQLTKCRGTIPPPVRKEGEMKKLSKHLKNWNPRHFVVRGDWIVDYYVKEDDYKKAPGKPRGTMNLSDMRVVTDLGNELVKRLTVLAEKTKLDISQLPKPDPVPDFTLELYHPRREGIRLQCANAEEFKEWCAMLERCRWNAPDLNITDDKVHVAIFADALWRTRWEVGMWGWWYSGGGEVNTISDLITEQIEDVVMCQVDAKLDMPWAARSRIRDGFMKAASGGVASAVGPAWKAAYEGVCKVRDPTREKLKELMDPIVQAQKELEEKICGAVDGAAKEALGASVTPHLQPLVEALFAPVLDAVKCVIKAFDIVVDAEKEKGRYEASEDRMFMVRHHGWCSELWEGERHMDKMYDPLWAVREAFGDVWPWGIISKANRRLRKLLKNALYTFEIHLEGGAPREKLEVEKKDWDGAKAAARQMLEADCRSAVLNVLGGILKDVVYPLWNKLVIVPSQKIVAPMADAIPDAVKDFVDVNDMLVSVLMTILTNACATVFEPFTSKIEL